MSRFQSTLFLKTCCYCQSREILFKHYFLDCIFLGNYTFSNSNILVEELVKRKRCFEIFLSEHCASDIGNKNIASNY